MGISAGEIATASDVRDAITERFGNGNYLGTDTVNRAIAHGLVTTPKIVNIHHDGTGIHFNIFSGQAQINYWASVVSGEYGVASVDGTNFYVGNAGSYTYSANSSLSNYNWVAIG